MKNTKKEEIAELYKVVQLLSGRERQIVVLRYGLNGNQAPITQQQVVDILKISRSYVSRIEKRRFCNASSNVTGKNFHKLLFVRTCVTELLLVLLIKMRKKRSLTCAHCIRRFEF